MNKRTCSVDGCESTNIAARGWCNRHWLRWSRHGDPLAGKSRQYRNPTEALRDKTRRLDNGCIEWTGADCPQGYGKMRYDNRNEYVHRVVWILANGPIPDGIFIDHICHNRMCCNLDHLRLATNKQNLEHRQGAQKNNRTSGVRGVSWSRPHSKWVAQVGHNGQNIYCGLYATVAEAEVAAIKVRLELHTHNDIDRAKEAIGRGKRAA